MKKYEDILKSGEIFRYQMLSRLKMDCSYYLGNGGRYTNHLWAEDEEEQILVMKLLWNSFPHGEKPEWLTWDEILSYESEMIN